MTVDPVAAAGQAHVIFDRIGKPYLERFAFVVLRTHLCVEREGRRMCSYCDVDAAECVINQAADLYLIDRRLIEPESRPP